MDEPPEEGYFTQSYQDRQSYGYIKDDERESAGPAMVFDKGHEDYADDEHVVQVIEQAVLADEAQRLPIPDNIEYQEGHRDGTGQDECLLGQAAQGVVVGSVHHITATRIEPEDDR